jgi:hypothetical protein
MIAWSGNRTQRQAPTEAYITEGAGVGGSVGDATPAITQGQSQCPNAPEVTHAIHSQGAGRVIRIGFTSRSNSAPLT